MFSARIVLLRYIAGRNVFFVVVVVDDWLMDLRPLGDRIVVRRIETSENVINGIIIPDAAKEKPQEGEVVAIGTGKRLDDGKLIELDVKVGDKILFGKYSGSEVKINDVEVLIIRQEEILGVIEG